MSKNILVTGGSGFLGINVAQYLKEKGYNPIVFDIKPSSYFSYITGDLLNVEDLKKATREVESVCHFGAIGDVYLAAENPSLACAVNVVGTANLINACMYNKIKKVVYASTWEVYGKPEYQPIDENHPCSPDHPYNITKLAGEQIALSYSAFKGISVISLRLGTAYGLYMRPNSVFSIFITKALQNNQITIKGTGEQFRQFTHARDIAHAFLLALESNIHKDIFNVVSSDKISIRNLAESVIKVLPTTIKYEEARQGDVQSAFVSSKKIEEKLCWKSQVSFETGLREIIDSYKKNKD